MATEEDVRRFLNELKLKVAVYGIIYEDHEGKNAQTLLDLEITSIQRKKYIQSLTYKDYSEGPLKESYYGGGEMWVFGLDIKRKLVYIKITLGRPKLDVICISFHIAEHKMQFPFK
jgi:hypothetical protein